MGFSFWEITLLAILVVWGFSLVAVIAILVRETRSRPAPEPEATLTLAELDKPKDGSSLPTN